MVALPKGWWSPESCECVCALAAIEAGAPIARPLTREEAINIVTEQIGLFESVLRRYGSGRHADRT
jgi:hypothetical protein